jgi:hypothetical protein
VFRLSRRTFGTGQPFLAAVALLSLNPLLLDHLSAARGYGMALAFWMWALELMLEYLESGQPLVSQKLNLNINMAAVCLGLSVASNLAFIVPAVALAFGFAVSLGTTGPARGLAHFTQHFAIPAFVTAFLVLVIPLDHADFATFNKGATSFRQTLYSITALSFFHSHTSSLPAVLATGVRVGLVLLVVAVVFAAAQILRRQEQGRVESLLVLLACTMPLTFVTLELAHRVFLVPFPVNGSALYFIPAATLAGLALFIKVTCKLNRKPLELGTLIVAVLCIAGYLIQFNFRIYGEWPQYAEARTMVKAIRSDAGLRHIRVAASAGMEPVLNYYRARYRLGNWDAVNPKPMTGSYDYYVLTQQDAGLVDQRHLRLVLRGTNLILAQ